MATLKPLLSQGSSEGEPLSITRQESLQAKLMAEYTKVHELPGLQAAGFTLPARDLRLLERHHSQPVYRRPQLSMGKNKTTAPWQWKQHYQYPQEQQQGYGKSWQYWPGTWSPRNRAAPPARYDQMPTETEQARPSGAQLGHGNALASMDTTVLQAVQKALTQDMRQKYLKQQQLFQQDMQKLEQEEETAKTAGSDAAQLVTAIVNGRQRPGPVTTTPGPDAWDQLLQEDMEVEEADGFLAQAQAALSLAPQAMTQAAPAPPAAHVEQAAPPGLPPPMGMMTGMRPPAPPLLQQPQQAVGPGPTTLQHMAGAAAPLQGYHALSPGNSTHRVEPFPASPTHSMPTRVEETKPMEPTSVDPVPTAAADPPKRPPAPKRGPLKATTKQSPQMAPPAGVSLGQKLETKRAAMQGTATLPFRVPPPNATGPPEPQETGEPPGTESHANIVDDDVDELNTAVVSGGPLSWGNRPDSTCHVFLAEALLLSGALILLLLLMAALIRFSSSIRGVGTGGLVAILLDLTHVGGHFFSAVLPQEIAFQTLQEYFRPLTTLEDEPLHVFIGCYDQPLSYRSTARLADGDVILVLKQNCGIPSKQTASSLFAPDAIWALPTDCYRLGFCTSVCVLHKDKRYCVPEHHHYGQSLVQYVSDMLRVNPYCTVSCTFPITDLEVQGELCPFVVAVAEVPSPEVTGINRDNARDIFVLLDPRPMGQKPCFLFLHHPVVHLPSVAAMLGLSTGKARRLGVHGGDRRGDDVFVDGCTALVLFAEEVDDASTGTDNSESSPAGVADHSLEPEPIVDALSQGLPLQLMPSADSSSPIGDVWGGGPQLTMEGVDLFDTTLPEGQSWNESFTAIHDRHEEVPSLADGHEESAPQIEPSRDMRTGDRVPHSLTRIAVLIYVPDFVPEILEVSVALPAAVEGLKGGPAHADLADMLLTAEGWDKDAPLPGPDVHFNSHFYILTEGMPFAFHVRPGRQATFREDIAQATGTAEHRLSLGTVTPRIVDAYPFGYWTSAVLVATDALSRVPCPPARVPEQRSILVLDQRRILRGIAWRFVRSRVLKVQDLADLYYDMCPFRHVVSLDGARIEGGKHAASKGIDVADWQCLDVHVAHTTVENFLALAGTSFASTCKLLDEPNADATHTSALASARDATRLLGGEWPFPPYRWPIELPALDDDAMLDVMVGEGVMTDIVLFLLTPDYSHERLDLTVELPQTVADVVDLAQTCRDASRKRLYPNLVELHQQPDPGWGIFLAVPSWLRHQAVVCIDSSLFDGRVFAISISSNTDRYVLCTSAGLAPTAEVDIYVPGHAGPLPLGADCQMATGMCVVFVRPGRARPASFQLSETLRSRLFWEHSPVFPQDSLGNGYCIAGPTGQVLFRLHPERAFFYRADIALLADLHPLRAVVTPAEPQQLDVSVRGWLCRTVVAATDRDDQTLWDGTVTSAIPGLLDCRPLLMGWLPVSSRARWLDLEPIRLALNQSAPPGWRICFPDLPAHWTWVCFHEGTVVRVALEEHNDHMYASFCVKVQSTATLMDSTPFAYSRPLWKTLSDELVNLATLLEDSLASPASEAFFLAATLLETLLEHYGGFFEDSTAAVHQPSRPISVFDSVPPPLFSLDVDSVQMPHSQDLIRKMYQPWPADWILAGKLIESQLPATTKQGLARLVPASDLFCERQSAQLSFSLYTDGSASQAKGQSGYATIILGHVDSNTAFLGALGDQISGRPDSPWNPEGPLALHAEHIAIAAAVLWAMQMRGTLSVVCCSLFFDCTAAGWSAEGSWQTSGPTSAFVHNLYMAARATPGIHLEFHHVRGHSNDPWNDLADHVAKSAASNTCDWPRPPSALCSLLTAQDISWLAPELDARVHHAVPIFDGALSWNGSRVIGPLLAPAQLVPTTGSAADDAEESSWFSIKAATINIQSLRGKCKYVEDQLDARSIHVAFLQETKLPGGTLTSAHYLRLHTDADSHWGVGIWVHRRLGVISMDGKALKVEESDFTILHEAPRLLVVVLNVGDLKIGLVSGHCPHATRQQERDDFLATLGSLMQRLKHTNLTFGGIDLNGRPPMNFAGVTGDLEFGEPDATGWGLVQILADAGMWIPSTYTQLHCGDSTTYVHPCGQPHRIDYILVGGRALVTDTRSEPDETFDNGSPQEDHTLLCLHLKGSTAVRYGQRKLLRPVYDREKILSPEGRALVREALAAFPHPSWHTHPDQHCVQIEEFLQEKLDLHFAQPPQQRRASYIPDNVWQQRDAKLHFKYRAQGDFGVGLLLGKQRLFYELASAAIRFATANIKKCISRAKNAYLYKLAGESCQGAAHILQRVKKAGVGGTKTRPVSRPLPILLHPEDGSAVTNREQRDAVWLLHFGKQEQGKTVCLADFIRNADLSCYEPDVEWSVAMLPTYGDIEKVLYEIKRNKAMGLDNIPGELLKAAPAETARLLFPLFLKSMLLQRQPLQWRGGVLYEAFKRSGLQSSVDNYRSLFVSSYVAKAYHRTVRNKTQDFCRDEMHPMHLGSRKNAPVTFAALFILTHLRRCRDLRHSAAVLYLDTSAAYCRIVRELAVGDIRADSTVLTLFQRFGLDAEDVEDLMRTIDAGGMLAQAGAPDALRQVVKDLHLHTWFVSRFSDGTRVCDSLAGSRPGESWADLIYAYIYSRVLHKVHEYAIAEGLTFTVRHDPAAGIFPPAHGEEELAATDTTWADDSAFPLEDVDPSELLRKTVRLCSLVLSFCTSHGMAPNLKPGKTSVLVSLLGKDSKKARGQYFPAGTQQLWLPDLEVGVAVTDQYKHLGGLVDCKLTMKPEARFRLAQAASSYDAAKTLLLNSPKLELKTRAALFATAVTPTFFNLGLWLPEGPAWDMLSSGYSKLVRRLLITDVGAHDALHVPLPVAHWCTGCWRLALVARRARLSLLVSLVKAGPPLLWAMLQSEATWLRTLQADLQWFVRSEEQQWPLVIEPAWPEWHALLRTAPQRFKRSLRRKLGQAHVEQCRQDAAVLGQWHCYRTLVQRQQLKAPTMAWICRICVKTFKTKAALGAHFFKVHGRVAGYRHVTHGTKCEACDTDFWTEGRLAAHLRSSPGCVLYLQQHAKAVQQIKPGFGSKKRRQDESTMFTLSLPLRRGYIPSAPEVPSWSKEQTSVYRELCNLLFDLDGAEIATTLCPAIQTVLKQSPLYPAEVDTILETIITEVQELVADGDEDPWPDTTAQTILATLADLRSGLWTATNGLNDRRLYHSLREFQSFLSGFDWDTRLRSLVKGDVTPSILEFSVPSDWEAEWQRNCSRIEVSAVAGDIATVLPEVLCRAWASLLSGCTVIIFAPQDFWSSALADGELDRRLNAVELTLLGVLVWAELGGILAAH
ncbi:unnamed protein product [Symbiodinium microadriaticum]|nr:unnamed protein product [Symbiodinium microadriaticum]CAE7949385.1 unnamed protein product [Symbiodinium sp. KB8]